MKFKHPEVVESWPPPNFINPETRGIELYVVNGIFFGLASLAVIMRLYTRIFIRKWFGWDDAFIVIAWICGMGDMATVFWGYHRFWWDRHMWDGKKEFLVPGAKTVFVAKLFWITTSTCVRLSLHVLYYRLLNHLDMRKYRWAVHCSLFFVVSIYLCYLGIIIFACVPVDQYFAWPPKGTCIDEGMADTIMSVFNTLSEIVVAALPIPMIMRLGMLTTERISVLCLLCLGFLVSIVGTVRTYWVWMVFEKDDLTWYAGPHWICSEVEISVAMICACMPAICPMIGSAIHSSRSMVNALQKKRSSWQERKSSAAVTITSMTDHSVTEYDAFYRTVDVEGIGLDGYGYTVKITAGENGPKKRNKLRKLIFKKDVEHSGGKEIEKHGREVRGSSRLSSRQLGIDPWHAHDNCEHEKRIEVVTRNSFEITQKPIERSLDRYEMPTMSPWTSGGSSTRQQGFPDSQSPQSFYYETDNDDQ